MTAVKDRFRTPLFMLFSGLSRGVGAPQSSSLHRIPDSQAKAIRPFSSLFVLFCSVSRSLRGRASRLGHARAGWDWVISVPSRYRLSIIRLHSLPATTFCFRLGLEYPCLGHPKFSFSWFNALYLSPSQLIVVIPPNPRSITYNVPRRRSRRCT
ncbi:hypothetical protein BJV78DRAFT_96707 [Lactifluus subvellereus]|nr:hypothetical protein BJV78DRAFT_96707 [Lactifluus subvellereus]